MTDVRRSAQVLAGARTASMSWVAALCAFAFLLAGLGWQMASGNDPSLGAAKPAGAVASAQPVRRVIVRRVVRRVIVTRVLPPRRPPVAAAAPAAAAPAAPAPVAAYVAPQRVVAQAPPAPRPAPQAVTRSS